MFKLSVLKTVTTILVSATMAIPAPSWAKSSEEGSVKDDVPVILQPVQLPDGQTGYFVVVPYPEEQESLVLESLAKSHPKNLILGVSGPDDPALQTALAGHNTAWVNSFVVANASEAQILNTNNIPKTLREKLKSKIAAINELCKRERTGLITAVIVSSILSGYIMVESASVSAGMKAFVALVGWVGFQAAFSEKWGAYLEKGGEIMTKLITSAVGRDVRNSELGHASEAFGKLHATWVANSAVVWWVFANAGTLHGWSLESAITVAFYGFMGSTDILDAVVEEKVSQGKLAIRAFKRFIIARIITSTMIEVANYAHVPHLSELLTVTTVAGALYLAFSLAVDHGFSKTVDQVKNLPLKTRALAQRLANASKNIAKTSCDKLLSKTKFHVASRNEGQE